MDSFTHEQNSICSQKLGQKQLNDIADEHTFICRQLFVDHVVHGRWSVRVRSREKQSFSYGPYGYRLSDFLPKGHGRYIFVSVFQFTSIHFISF